MTPILHNQPSEIIIEGMGYTADIVRRNMALRVAGLGRPLSELCVEAGRHPRRLYFVSVDKRDSIALPTLDEICRALLLPPHLLVSPDLQGDEPASPPERTSAALVRASVARRLDRVGAEVLARGAARAGYVRDGRASIRRLAEAAGVAHRAMVALLASERAGSTALVDDIAHVLQLPPPVLYDPSSQVLTGPVPSAQVLAYD